MDAKHSVVWLDDCGGNLRASPDSEAQLGVLAIINGEALKHEASKTTASAVTNRVEDHEALRSCAIVGKLADAVEHQVNDLLTNGVVAACCLQCPFMAQCSVVPTEHGICLKQKPAQC